MSFKTIPKGGCAWIWFSCEKCGSEYNIFGIAIMMGAGGSAMLINSLAIVASLIGNNLGKPSTHSNLYSSINISKLYTE